MFGPYFRTRQNISRAGLTSPKYNPEMKFTFRMHGHSYHNSKKTDVRSVLHGSCHGSIVRRKKNNARRRDGPETHPEKAVLPTSDAMVLLKHFLRGELPGVEGIHRVIGRRNVPSGEINWDTLGQGLIVWKVTCFMQRFTVNHLS